jgi:predicted  nucleic acid-binding Zn-ribbon protein
VEKKMIEVEQLKAELKTVELQAQEMSHALVAIAPCLAEARREIAADAPRTEELKSAVAEMKPRIEELQSAVTAALKLLDL